MPTPSPCSARCTAAVQCSPAVNVDHLRVKPFFAQAGTPQAPGPISDAGQEGEHEVGLLLNRRVMRGVTRYLVRWRGHTSCSGPEIDLSFLILDLALWLWFKARSAACGARRDPQPVVQAGRRPPQKLELHSRLVGLIVNNLVVQLFKTRQIRSISCSLGSIAKISLFCAFLIAIM